jgi:hypothetical protein
VRKAKDLSLVEAADTSEVDSRRTPLGMYNESQEFCGLPEGRRIGLYNEGEKPGVQSGGPQAEEAIRHRCLCWEHTPEKVQIQGDLGVDPRCPSRYGGTFLLRHFLQNPPGAELIVN